MEIGSIAEWVSGISSAAAVSTALWFWIKDRIDKDREQRTAVGVWVQFDNDDGWKLVCKNNTDLPVWNWGVIISWNNHGILEEVLILSNQVGLLPPGLSYFPWVTQQELCKDSQVNIEFAFLDSQGETWVRSNKMGLKKLPKNQCWRGFYAE